MEVDRFFIQLQACPISYQTKQFLAVQSKIELVIIYDARKNQSIFDRSEMRIKKTPFWLDEILGKYLFFSYIW